MHYVKTKTGFPVFFDCYDAYKAQDILELWINGSLQGLWELCIIDSVNDEAMGQKGSGRQEVG
jgi:hypothetical protein